MRLLVVAAWEPELARFRERLAAASAARDAAVEIVLATLGVGLVEAAIATTHCVARHRPDAALLLGTCGGFGSALPVGAVVAGAHVRLADATVAAGAAALPEPMPSSAPFDPALHDALVGAGAKSVQIANTAGITSDDALASRLASLGDVEHLEAFGFARACAVAGVPCAASLAIANAVGSSGRAEWLANHVRASAAAADLAYAALDALTIRTSTTARSPERA